ncbi:hypothetical protein HDV00_010728 [Rhizophlyctis rosea]|nr:hypothetical protein HDV00_010728 [Rhizophlyctis rosea]
MPFGSSLSYRAPSTPSSRIGVFLSLTLALLATTAVTIRAITTGATPTTSLTNAWGVVASLDHVAALTLLLPYTYYLAPTPIINIALTLLTLACSPFAILLSIHQITTSNPPSLVPFPPGTVLSPNKPSTYYLRYTSILALTLWAWSVLRAWHTSGFGVWWFGGVRDGGAWGVVTVVDDVATAVWAGCYISEREHWRWSVLGPVYVALVLAGNGFTCLYLILASLHAASIQDAVMVRRPVLGAIWPWNVGGRPDDMLDGEGGAYLEIDEDLEWADELP